MKHCGNTLWHVCFCSAGTRALFQPQLGGNSKYQSVLAQNLKAFCYKAEHEEDRNTDPKHTSKSTKEWFLQKKIKVLVWPSKSPESNWRSMWWSEEGCGQDLPLQSDRFGSFIQRRVLASQDLPCRWTSTQTDRVLQLKSFFNKVLV